jgi:ACR3 family arsenite efflux pump ArsB
MASKLTLAEVPLLIGGLFMVYLAVLDETLFNFVLDNVTQNQFTVSLATVIAAALPMFFAVGFIKRSILRRWQTIYYYEKMLLGEVFWILTVILLNIITFIILSEQGVHQFNAPILAGCVLFSIYLVIYSFKTRQKSYP